MLRWSNADTGEVKERPFRGREAVVLSPTSPQNPTDGPWCNGEYDEWEVSALDLALGLVPDLHAAIGKAVADDRTVEVLVRTIEAP